MGHKMEFTVNIDRNLWEVCVEDGSGLFEAKMADDYGGQHRVYGAVSPRLTVHMETRSPPSSGFTMGSMDYVGYSPSLQLSGPDLSGARLVEALTVELYKRLEVIVNGDERIRRQVLADHPGITYAHHPSKDRPVKVNVKDGFALPRFVDRDWLFKSTAATVDSSIIRGMNNGFTGEAAR